MTGPPERSLSHYAVHGGASASRQNLIVREFGFLAHSECSPQVASVEGVQSLKLIAVYSPYVSDPFSRGDFAKPWSALILVGCLRLT